MSRVINKEIEQVAIDLLKHHPRNANHGDVEAIKKSLAVNGWYGSVVANLTTKHILAGNHRVMAAKALGWETVPVQWVDVTPEEELRILVVDNRTTRIGQDDTTKITDILAELANTPIGLDGTGYSAVDLDALIDSLTGTGEPEELLTDPDEVPEVVETRCQPGDLWILGSHRLLCGDSTKVDDVERLMGGANADMVFTDPPYGVSFVGVKSTMYAGGEKVGKNTSNEIMGDDLRGEDLSKLFKGAISNAISVANNTAAIYIFFAINRSTEVLNGLSDCGIEIRNWLVWDKGNVGFHAMGAQYKPNFEAFLYCHRKDSKPEWIGSNQQQTIWRHSVERLGIHPTTKPVSLVVQAFENHPGLTVIDTFLGSGTTLIAAEQVGRKCYGLELDPHYCDVIIQRWENATGKKAVLDGTTNQV